MKQYDFANILFAGPCNLRCPYCIGRQLDPALSQNNLAEFPPRNIDVFAALLVEYHVTKVVFTGTTTDPQLYRYEERLLDWLRQRLPAGTRFSLHTNGLLALRKMAVFNAYDQATVSFPSFDPAVYYQMTGSVHIPNLPEILRRATIPVKISCVITEHNVGQVNTFLEQCGTLGIERVVLRKLYDDVRQWTILQNFPIVSLYCGNPVYDFYGIQVTFWNFDQTNSTSLNLFSDGTLSADYLLARANPPQRFA